MPHVRVTKRTNIALRLLMFCAVQPDRLVTKNEIAARCNASENHLGQIIHRLGLLGYLNTRRGRKGGLQLAMPARQINIGSVFRAMEAPVPMTECFADADNSCPLTHCCLLRPALAAAAEAFYATLDRVTLDNLTSGNTKLEQLLCLDMPVTCHA